jgi:hypothetical protein
VITKSLFYNQNAYTNLTSLASRSAATLTLTSLELLPYRVPIHRGLIMNVHDFNGAIEFAENLVGFNVVYIPEYKQWY